MKTLCWLAWIFVLCQVSFAQSQPTPPVGASKTQSPSQETVSNSNKAVEADSNKQQASATTKQISDSLEVLKKQIKEIKAKLDTISTKSIIRVGLSIGVRQILTKRYVDPYIAPMDSLLRLSEKDKKAVVISAVVTVAPFKKADGKRGAFSWLSFVANVNLADFTSDETATIKSKSIEGGLGIGVELHKDFALAVTYERVFNKELRQEIQNEFKGKKLIENGKVLSELNEKNHNLFRDDNKNAFAIRFIYYL